MLVSLHNYATDRIDNSYSSFIIFYICLAFSGAAWIPAFSIVGVTIELSNLSSIICIFFLLVGMVKSFKIRIPFEIRLWLISLSSVTVMLLIHGGGGIGITIRSLVSLIGALIIINVALLKDQSFVKVVNFSFFTFIFLIWSSSEIVGLSLVSAISNYLTSFNRNAFTYDFMRVLFNAFSQGEEEQYVASVINAMAASLTMFYLISTSFVVAGFYRMLPVSLLSLTACFVLFSSSSILACALGSVMIFVCWVKHSRNTLAPVFTFMLVLFVLVFTNEIIYSYLEFNLNSDTTSRAHRIYQIGQSLKTINNNLFFGVGHVTFNGYEIHNWFLFSWVSGGLFTAILAMLANLSIVFLIFYGFVFALKNKKDFHIYLIVATLPIIFLINVNVSGGGGTPSGPSLISLFVAIAFRYAAKNEKKESA